MTICGTEGIWGVTGINCRKLYAHKIVQSINRNEIKTRDDYNKAVTCCIQVFQVEDQTPESEELDLLRVLMKDNEAKHIILPNVDPI